MSAKVIAFADEMLEFVAARSPFASFSLYAVQATSSAFKRSQVTLAAPSEASGRETMGVGSQSSATAISAAGTGVALHSSTGGVVRQVSCGGLLSETGGLDIVATLKV